MKRTYEEWLKYYENATKEQVIEDTMHDMEEITRLNKELGIFQRENDLLKHKLNYIAFGDDSELALRFLRRIGYVDFDEERKVYINKHNNEPFLWKEEQEKDYYLKDEELNEYTQQLEYKVDRLNNIIKIMENYLELIYDLGYDHDGLETTGDLMNLMGELVRYASLGRAYNITEPIYENSGKKYNILHEELKENNKE